MRWVARRVFTPRVIPVKSDRSKESAKTVGNTERRTGRQRQARFHCVLVYLRHAEDPTRWCATVAGRA